MSLLEQLVASEATPLRVQVERCIAECPYAFVFRDVTFYLHKGKIVLDGRVPSFQLKRDLESRLKKLGSVVNRVEVVNSNGLSSAGHAS